MWSGFEVILLMASGLPNLVLQVYGMIDSRSNIHGTGGPSPGFSSGSRHMPGTLEPRELVDSCPE